MTKNVLTLDISTPANLASRKMDESGVGSVIVTENNQPVGIVTERDFATRMIAYSYPSYSRLSIIMSSPIIHVTPTASIMDVADLMAKKKLRKIPVIDGFQVVGIITSTDLLNLFTLLTEDDFKNLYKNYLRNIYDQETT